MVLDGFFEILTLCAYTYLLYDEYFTVSSRGGRIGVEGWRGIICVACETYFIRLDKFV